MRKITIEAAEELALKMRAKLRMSGSEPVNVKTALRQIDIMTVYRPLSEEIWGLSLKSCDGEMFILVNSNTTRGSQHFTIAHELFHLFYDENPRPHFCNEQGRDAEERSANMFASALLMPKEGLSYNIPAGEIIDRAVSIDTALRLEQLYGVSHSTLALRLKQLKMISEKNLEYLQTLSVRTEAVARGVDLSLYYKGNENVVLGDYGRIAKKLFDGERISEGHYLELMKKIGYGEGTNRP